MLDENERIFKNGFINSNPERRKVYGNHFYSAPLGIRTFMRVYSKEHNELINTLLYERMITKWCEFNHKLPLWVKTEIDRYINSPVFSKEEFIKIMLFINKVCTDDKEFLDFIIFNLIPWKIEEYELYNKEVNNYDNIQSVDISYNKKLLLYINTFLRNARIGGCFNSYSLACLLFLLFLEVVDTSGSNFRLSDFSVPYINYLRLYRFDYAHSLENHIAELSTKYKNKEIDELDILQNINDINDCDTEMYFSKMNIYHESIYKDIVTFSNNEYQIFGEKVYDGDETKFIYQIERLTPEEIWHYMGSNVRVDFELTENMLGFIRYNLKPYECIMRSMDGHIRRHIVKIDDNVFLLFKIYNDSENIYGITLTSTRDMNGEEYRDVLQIKMDDSDYKLKVGDSHDNG